MRNYGIKGIYTRILLFYSLILAETLSEIFGVFCSRLLFKVVSESGFVESSSGCLLLCVVVVVFLVVSTKTKQLKLTHV